MKEVIEKKIHDLEKDKKEFKRDLLSIIDYFKERVIEDEFDETSFNILNRYCRVWYSNNEELQLLQKILEENSDNE